MPRVYRKVRSIYRMELRRYSTTIWFGHKRWDYGHNYSVRPILRNRILYGWEVIHRVTNKVVNTFFTHIYPLPVTSPWRYFNHE